MEIPRATLPKALDIPHIYFKPPTADVPAYKPMIVPPADLEPLRTFRRRKQRKNNPNHLV